MEGHQASSKFTSRSLLLGKKTHGSSTCSLVSSHVTGVMEERPCTRLTRDFVLGPARLSGTRLHFPLAVALVGRFDTKGQCSSIKVLPIVVDDQILILSVYCRF